MSRDVEVNDPSPAVPQDDEAVQQPKRDRRHHEEVAGGRAAHVVLEERSPGLGWWSWAAPNHVPRYGRFCDLVAQQAKLGLDPRRSPEWITQGHATDQSPDLGVDHGSAGLPRLPSPVKLESSAVPLHNRRWLDDHQGRAPVRPES